MKYKALAAAAAAVTIFSAASAFAAAPYTDLGSLPSRDAVDYLYDTQCLTFVNGNTFSPDKVMTRGEVAQLIYDAAANLPLADLSFTDVTPGRPADAMAAVSAQGILSGYADGSFQPDKEVTREEFAGVLYRYLQYCRLADADGDVAPYDDEASVLPENLQAVQVLHSKNIMVPEDNMFRPKEGMTRREAADVIYRLLHSDEQYVSHVQIMMQVIKCIDAEYGSTLAYFQYGTMYWDGNTLVLGVKGRPGKYLQDRIEDNVSRPDAVVIRKARFSRTDYGRIMNQAINVLVRSEGVQNYVGAVPDYAGEQIVMTVRRPVSQQTIDALVKRVGADVLRIEMAAAPGAAKVVQQVRPGDDVSDEEAKSEEAASAAAPVRHDEEANYSPLIDRATSKAIAVVENDNMT